MVAELRVIGTLPSEFKHLVFFFFFWLRRVSWCSPGCSVDQACLCFLRSGIKVMCDHHLGKHIFSKHAFIYWCFCYVGVSQHTCEAGEQQVVRLGSRCASLQPTQSPSSKLYCLSEVWSVNSTSTHLIPLSSS